MSVEINGLKELVFDLRAFPDKIQEKVIARLSQVAYNSAQKGAGRHVVTGALYQSLFNRPIAGGRQVGHDTRRAPHAKFVIQGTRPHTIRPKNKKALRWVDGNGFRFAKFVNHPGYRGDPYMDAAADDALRQFIQITTDATKGSI